MAYTAPITNKEGQVLVEGIESDGLINFDVSNFAYGMKPADTPFTTLIEKENKTRKVMTKEFKFNTLGEINKLFTVDAKGAVDNVDVIRLTSVTGLQVTDQVMVVDSSEAGVNKHWSRIIIAVDKTEKTITLDAVTGFGGELIAGNKVYLSGRAAGEGGLSPNAVMPQTSQGQNYVQQIKVPIEMSNDMLIDKKYLDVSSIYRIKGMEFYKTLFEMAYLFSVGQKSADDDESKPIYTMQGFYTAMNDATNTTFPFYSSNELQSTTASLLNLAADGSTFTQSVFMGFLSDFMTYKNSDTKILMIDSWLSAKISAFGESFLRTTLSDNVLGITIKRVEVPSKGFVDLVYNPHFERGMNFKGAIGFDPANVKKCQYRPTTIQMKIQENDRDGKKDQILGSYSVEWANLETTGLISHL